MCCCCCCLLLFESSSACLMSHPFVVVVHSHRERLQIQQAGHWCLLTSCLRMTAVCKACKLGCASACLLPLYSLQVWRYAHGKTECAHVLCHNKTGQHGLSVLLMQMLAMRRPPNLQAIRRLAHCNAGKHILQDVKQTPRDLTVRAKAVAKLPWQNILTTPSELTLLAWS